MAALTYESRRSELRTYFDRTALDAWAKLTSDVPVSGIRATVRAGRDETRATLLSWMDDALAGMTVYDAGCGTGALSVAAAGRGAEVTGVDLSPRLIELAQERLPGTVDTGSVRFVVGDMVGAVDEQFDYVVAMDSLIHYEVDDVVAMLVQLSAKARRSVLFTFAPKTTLLTLMHRVGRLFPKGDRAPAIVPIAESRLRAAVAAEPRLEGWRVGRTHRVATGFYTSQSMELTRT